MSITNNLDYASKIRSLVNHGWARKERPVDIKSFDLDEVKSRYWFTSVGHSFRVTELEAAIALGQIANYKTIVQQRRDNVNQLNTWLSGLSDWIECPILQDGAVYMMYPILIKQGHKWGLTKHLEKNGIETREMLPLINQPIYREFINPDDYPVSKMILEQGVYVGCHQYLTKVETEKIVGVIHDYFK